MVLVKRLDAKTRHFFTIYDSTGHLLRLLYLNFCANGDNNNRTDYFTPCVCAQGNETEQQCVGCRAGNKQSMSELSNRLRLFSVDLVTGNVRLKRELVRLSKGVLNVE